MFANIDYVRVGQLDDLKRAGYLKILLKGRQIMIVFSDSGLVAMDLDSALDPSGQAAMLQGFHGLSTSQSNFLTGSFNKNWGRLTTYPVKIDGNNLLIGVNPFN